MAVSVGDGVSVLRGVGVIVAVGVDVGRAAAVRVDAAFEVCAMNVLTAPGTGVETDGAVNVGTHARTRPRAINHERIFVLRVDISPPEHPKRNQSGQFFSIFQLGSLHRDSTSRLPL